MARFFNTAQIALDMLSHIAGAGDAPVSLAAVATQQNCSISYLEQIAAKLKKAGIVASMRGPGGGYTLVLPETEITVKRVINAVQKQPSTGTSKTMRALYEGLLKQAAGVTLQDHMINAARSNA